MEILSGGFKSLKTLIEKTKLGKPEGTKRATVVSICSQKGGVGKTTTSVNLAFTLTALHGKNVLLIDLDPQGHVETSLTSIIPDGQKYIPLSKLLLDKTPDLMESTVKTELDGFFLTPGDKTLIESESLITTKIGKEFLLKEALDIAITHYDYIFIDCPPNLGNLTLNALVASQFCIVPCEMSMLSLEGVSDIFETVQTINERLNRRLSILGILLTRVDSRNQKLNFAIREELEKHAKGYLFSTEITVNSDLAKAQMAGKPILTHSPYSTGAKNYRDFTTEFSTRIQNFLGNTRPAAKSEISE